MKKFFEKYDLLKVSGILVLLCVVLTWILPYGYFSGTEFVSEEINRIGVSTFFNFGLLGAYYFTVLITFLFVTGGFYQVLSKRAGYQKLIKNISEKFKGHVIPVVLLVSLIFAILSSLMNEYFPLLALIPFVITILNRLKVDKITSFVATFGGLLVGTIGSTYSTKVAGQIIDTLQIENADVLTTQAILFVVAFILLSVFTVLRLKKSKADKKFEEYDKFALETIKEKNPEKTTRSWPYAILMILLFLTIALAYLPWSSWEVTLFDDITLWFNEFEIAGVPFISYIFGEVIAFGKWDIFTIQFVMLFATLLIHWFGHMSLDEVFESYGEGFKKIAPTVIVMLMVYFILELAVMFPVVPAIVDWLASLTEGFSAGLTYIGTFITSMFSIEIQYGMQLSGTFYAAAYKDVLPAIAMMFQTTFGLVSFFVPSSAILMLGLSYLNISYKDWLKFIWKFLLAMFAVTVIIVIVLV